MANYFTGSLLHFLADYGYWNVALEDKDRLLTNNPIGIYFGQLRQWSSSFAVRVADYDAVRSRGALVGDPQLILSVPPAVLNKGCKNL